MININDPGLCNGASVRLSPSGLEGKIKEIFWKDNAANIELSKGANITIKFTHLDLLQSELKTGQ